MYDGKLISDLMSLVESICQKHLPRQGDHYDQLCEAKVALADKMSEEIRDTGKVQRTTEQLWKQADRLQESI